MQIIKLTLNHPNFFCPATGIQILNATYFNEDVPSVLGHWLDEQWEEPRIKSDELRKEWENYLRNGGEQKLENGKIKHDQFYALELFFNQVKMDNVVVFRLNSAWLGGPVPYVVIDMDYHEENEDENNRDLKYDDDLDDWL